MKSILTRLTLLAILALPLNLPATSILTANLSYPTIYEEEDNIHIALRSPPGQPVASFVVEARHPVYPVGHDNSHPGRFPPPENDPAHPYKDPGTFKLYDDGRTLIEAVRKPTFWRDQAMTARAGNTTIDNVHLIQFYRRIEGDNSRPTVAVFYTDGNIRLKPHPQPGRHDQVFGTSILLGPTPDAKRPVADVHTIDYDPKLDAFTLTYRPAGSATIRFESITRNVTRVHVTINYTADAFARIRSMFVAEGNSDVDHIDWKDDTSPWQSDQILSHQSTRATELLFHRKTRSTHNTSAPDLWLGQFIFKSPPPPSPTPNTARPG